MEIIPGNQIVVWSGVSNLRKKIMREGEKIVEGGDSVPSTIVVFMVPSGILRTIVVGAPLYAGHIKCDVALQCSARHTLSPGMIFIPNFKL